MVYIYKHKNKQENKQVKIMASHQIMKASDVDLNLISYSDLRKLDSGAKTAFLNYGPDKGGRFTIQTPRMVLPFNMSTFDKGDYPKHSIEVSFRGMEERPKLREFYDLFSNLDTKLINDGTDPRNSINWFKKKSQPREVVEALFYPHIKPSTDKITGEPNGKYPATMRLKLPARDGQFQFEVFDLVTEQKIDLNETPLNQLLVKGTKIRALIQCSALWFAGGKFGCSWKVAQLCVQVPARLNHYAFVADSEDDGDFDETPQEQPSNQVDDSETESEESEEDVPPEPVKIVKKKVTKRGRGKKAS